MPASLRSAATVVLPAGMSGPDIAREARFIRPDLKVVFTSGYPDREFENQTYGAHDALFLRKPFRLSELADAMEAAMNQ